jgi:hypothetical protein
MDDASPAQCPLCAAPLAMNGTFCKRCGYDAAHAQSDDAHLDGVDLPQGYAPEDPYVGKPAERPRAGRKEWTVVAVVVLVFAALGFASKLFG